MHMSSEVIEAELAFESCRLGEVVAINTVPTSTHRPNQVDPVINQSLMR
jgi:hypothetical protein